MVDATEVHVYQPGWLYIPFDQMKAEQLVRPERSPLSRRVELRVTTAEVIDPVARTVALGDGSTLEYDALVVATGARLDPEAVPGFAKGAYHFYALEAAAALRQALDEFRGGHVVLGVADLPYKCPPAPLEFTFMLEDKLRQRGLRDRTTLTYLSPIGRAFTIEPVSEFVTPLLEERGVDVQIFVNTESIDPVNKTITSLEGDTISYDLLVLVPPHRGAHIVINAGLGDEQGWLRTDRNTLEHLDHPEIFGLGDATGVPVSKSGSAAHFEARVVANRIVDRLAGVEPSAIYHGHVMCFLETGHNMASQLVFDNDHPPHPHRPNPIHHLEKTIFNRAYWYLVPRGLV